MEASHILPLVADECGLLNPQRMIARRIRYFGINGGQADDMAAAIIRDARKAFCEAKLQTISEIDLQEGFAQGEIDIP